MPNGQNNQADVVKDQPGRSHVIVSTNYITCRRISNPSLLFSPLELVSNIPYGSGTARSKTDAKEEAARKTLDIIQRQHVAVNCVAGFQWATNQNSSSSSYPSSSSRKPTTTTQRTTSTSTSHRYVHPNQAPQSSQTSQTYGYGYSYAYPYTTSHGYVYPGNH